MEAPFAGEYSTIVTSESMIKEYEIEIHAQAIRTIATSATNVFILISTTQTKNYRKHKKLNCDPSPSQYVDSRDPVQKPRPGFDV